MAGVAVVTGGTRGIGLAISRRLREEGRTVVALYATDAESADKARSDEALAVYRCDVSDFEACAMTFGEIADQHGPVDVLVNNAGITRDRMCHKMQIEEWQSVLRTNLDSMFNTTRQVLPAMRSSQWGRIINISSINGQKGQVGQVNYSAAKAGVLGFTRALALEVAGHGVTVNAVAPGYIETSMTAAMPTEVLEAILQHVPTRRLGTPEEVAECVAFLASTNAAFINGATLSMNGGQYCAG